MRSADIRKKTLKYILPFVSVGVVVVIFYILSAIVNDEMTIPSPTKVFAEFFALFGRKVFYKEILYNLLRTLASFSAAFIAAVLFAVPAALNDVFDRLFHPITVMLRAVPTMAIFLWCLIIFRSSVSPMAVAFIVVFPMLYSAVYGSIRSRDKKIDEMAKIFCVGKAEFVFKVVLPDVFNRLFSQVVSILSFTVKLIVAGEVLASTQPSIGREMQLANVYEMARLFALTIAVILLSVILEMAAKGCYFAIRKIRYGHNRRKIIEKLR